jgi:3-phenylpropionate/trans-cinnamate dioxygenase ferredoxin reductase subunit
MNGHIVIVGAGHAAAQVVDSLRREGFTGALTLVGDEPHLPYQRPPLSKKFLAGELPLDRLFIRPETFYANHGVTLRLGQRATAIDLAAQQVTLADGAALDYTQLLLCPGSHARKVTAHGANLPGIHYLRNAADVEAIRSRFRPGARVVIVGAGYIGLETAATCRKAGLEVDVLEMADRPMNRVVAPEVSAFFADQHAREGVRIHISTVVSGFDGDANGVREVHTLDGRVFPADLVVAGIGVLPETALAEAAGIACDNGIAVDSHCRTSDPHVYAIGDCVSAPSLRYRRRVRLESVDNAFEQAKTAAANMVGRETMHDKVPWFWSDQYDLKLLIVGLNFDYDQVVIRGDTHSRSFACAYLRHQELLAIDCVNNPKDYMAARKVIEACGKVDPAKLADPSIALKDTVVE